MGAMVKWIGMGGEPVVSSILFGIAGRIVNGVGVTNVTKLAAEAKDCWMRIDEQTSGSNPTGRTKIGQIISSDFWPTHTVTVINDGCNDILPHDRILSQVFIEPDGCMYIDGEDVAAFTGTNFRTVFSGSYSCT